MAAPVISQKEYLKKYLSGSNKSAKKKKKSSKKSGTTSKSKTKIIDDDVDLRKLDAMGQMSDDEYGEDAPQIAAIIDERPAHLQGKWKTLRESPEEDKEINFDGNPLSQLLKDDDISPPRKRHDSDSDMSPPRHRNIHEHESNSSINRGRKQDLDISPPRSRRRHDSDSDVSPPRNRRRHNAGLLEPASDNNKRLYSDVNVLPSRSRKRHDSNSDMSPPRNRKRHDCDRDVSLPKNRRRHNAGQLEPEPNNSKRFDSDSDMSPPRSRNMHDLKNVASSSKSSKGHNYNKEISPSRSRKRHESDSDYSLPSDRKTHKAVQSVSSLKNGSSNSDSDMSPPRSKKGYDYSRDISQMRNRKRLDSDSDISISKSRKGRDHIRDVSPSRNRRRHDSDSDDLLQRRRKVDEHNRDTSPQRNRNKKRHDSSDTSPHDSRKMQNISSSVYERKPHHSSQHRVVKSIEHASQRRDNGGDVTSPRHRKRHDTTSSREMKLHAPEKNTSLSWSKSGRKDVAGDLSPPRRKSGYGSDSDGSSSRRQRDVTVDDRTKRKEDVRQLETLSGMKAGLQDASSLREELKAAKEREKAVLEMMGTETGREAQTVYRDRATGKKRDLKEERRQKRKEAEKLAEQQEKYMEWGRGVKQTADKKTQLEEELYEMSKPLARYQDDPDLERHLKDQERAGDPMLEFIRKRKAKQNPEQKAAHPTYKGPPPPPNRFGIAPGYRWDGVDRSNGFEKRIFEKSSGKVALEDEAYKWSVSDM